MAFLIDNKQGVPTGMLFGRKPETVLTILVMKCGSRRAGRKVDRQLTGRMKSMAENKGFVRLGHLRPDGFHPVCDLLPTEEFIG